jgi:hypothetical protein
VRVAAETSTLRASRNASGPAKGDPDEILRRLRESGFGYFLEMATRPQTIGYALLDSPVALAAWLLDHDTDSYYRRRGYWSARTGGAS